MVYNVAMKHLRNCINDINDLLANGAVVHLVDSRTHSYLSFRKKKNRSLSFHRVYDYEVDKHIDEFLGLDIDGIADHGNYVDYLTENLSTLLRKYDIIY